MTLFTVLAGWLITYMLHSLLCCAAALGLGRWAMHDPHSRDRLWKFGLVAPILTATWTTIVAAFYPERGISTLSSVSIAEGGGKLEMNVPLALSMIAMVLIAFGLLRFARRRRLATRMIADRHPLPGASTVWTSVPAFVYGRAVLLSLSDAISSPIALDRAEICLPIETFLELTSSQQRSILAHEIAHLVRRDPQWMLLGSLIAGATLFQPLNALVLECLRRDAEFICDDIAVGGKASPKALAESLAVFARHFDPVAFSALGSHYGGSPLVERAERILGPRSQARPIRQFATGGVMVACSLLALTPALTIAGTHPRETEPRLSAPRLITEEKDVVLDFHTLNRR